MTSPATPPPLPQPARRIFKKRYILLLLVAAFVGWQIVQRARVRMAINAARAAGQPTTPAELEAFYEEVPETNNLAIPLLEAEAALTIRTNGPRASDPLQYPSLEDAAVARPLPPDRLESLRAMVTTNAAAWAALLQTEGRTGSRYPIDLTAGLSAELPHLTGLRRLAKASALRALLAAEEGNAAESTTAIVDTLRTSRSLSKEPLAISAVVAGGGEILAAMVIRDCAQRVRFDESQLARIDSEIRAIDLPGRTRRALIGQRALGHSAFSNLRIPRSSASDAEETSQESVNQGLQILNWSGLAPNDNAFQLHIMAGLIEAAGKPFPQSLDDAELVAKEFDEATMHGTRFLHVFSSLYLIPIVDLISQAATAEAHRRMALTILAIERFRLRNNNRPPETLSELMPTFLTEVPSDPFDGQPLRYQRNVQGYRLYSIGRDRVDQGGKAVPRKQRRDNFHATDFVLEVTR